MASVSLVEDETAIAAIRDQTDAVFDVQTPNFISDEEISFAKANIGSLPIHVRASMKELEKAFQEGEVTEKGFSKKMTLLLSPHLPKLHTTQIQEEEFVEPALHTLPKFVLEQINDLDKELKDEEITAKGYKRKRDKLLAPFMLKEPPLSTLPKIVLKELETTQNEFKEGDLTEKGYRKRRAKLIRPYLVKANAWSSTVNVMPTKGNTVTVFMQTPPDCKRDSPAHAAAVGIQIINGTEKLFKCQLCNEIFKQAQSFSGHCRLHRTGKTKAFKCTVCNASYTTRSHLKFHMYKHNGNYPYSCEFCGKGFAGRSQYRYHVLRHSGQSPYICKECGGRFWKKRNLEVHCEKHRCDDAPPGLQKCAHCHAMFEELDELQTHMYEHDDGTEGEATMVSKQIKEESGSLSSKSRSSEELMEEGEAEEEEEQVSDEESGKDSEPENNIVLQAQAT